MIKATRRKFFGFAGAGAVAAKGATDKIIAESAGIYSTSGIGNSGIGLSQGAPPSQFGEVAKAGVRYLPYEDRVIQAGDYIKVFGLPEWLEFEMRDSAKYVGALDPDLAAKRSWSMSVKIAEQRGRNYKRRLENMQRSGAMHRGRKTISKLLGFEFPF